ncbi:MAG TPA: hypothetical protein EYP49_20120, partial [Anaerolineae bacterium]|nr:hypothetical protein [Anaerolineae bacterium]
MNKTSLALKIGLIALLVILFLSLAPALAAGFVNFLTNPGLETFNAPYDYYDGHPLQVAQNWTAFTKSGVTPKYMTNDEWAAMTGGAAEHLEGNYSQMYWETGAFAAGIYQQVSVTPGTAYAAQASILTIWETSATHTDGKMLKQVGIDPNGGTDPNSPDIVWGPTKGSDVKWESVKTSAAANSSTITLFVLVTSEASSSPSLRNQVFVDAVVLTEAPTASATSPDFSRNLSFTVEWSGTPAYSGNPLEYDVEYKVDDGSWTFWKGKTASTAATFGPTSPTTVEYGHTYHFRARAWEEYGYYGSVKVKLPGVFAEGNGDTSTSVGGIYGYVRNNQAGSIGGATVAISGTTSSTTTEGSGYYSLPLPTEGSCEVTASHSAYISPPEVPIEVYSTTTTIPLTFTLRPPDDVVVNGDFEGNLDGWTVTGPAPAVVTSPRRSGDYSLAMSGTSGMTQTHSVAAMHEPTLSFWYRIATSETNGDDSFTACLYQNDPSDCAATFAVTPTADV